MRIILMLIAIGLLANCSTKENLPSAVGLPGDLYLIMDSLQWKGPLGATVDSIFRAEMPGLPRKEPLFKMRWVDPRRFSVLKGARNLIFVMTLDQSGEGARIVRRQFTPASIEKIKNNPADYVTTTPNVYANGQEVMFLYGTDEKLLQQNLRANSARLVAFYNQKEKDRMTRSLFKSGQMTGISEILNKEFDCNMKIPFGYKLVEKLPDFVWVRQTNPRDDKILFIARKPYSSLDDFKVKNLIRFRDEVCQKHLFEDPDRIDSYLLTETTIPFIPITADTVNFNGHFAIQLRGLYRSNTLGMGGPFLGFAMVDEGNQQFYYIEGFTNSPGKDQREIMRELETILYTFRTSKEIQKKK